MESNAFLMKTSACWWSTDIRRLEVAKFLSTPYATTPNTTASTARRAILACDPVFAILGKVTSMAHYEIRAVSISWMVDEILDVSSYYSTTDLRPCHVFLGLVPVVQRLLIGK